MPADPPPAPPLALPAWLVLPAVPVLLPPLPLPPLLLPALLVVPAVGKDEVPACGKIEPLPP